MKAKAWLTETGSADHLVELRGLGPLAHCCGAAGGPRSISLVAPWSSADLD